MLPSCASRLALPDSWTIKSPSWSNAGSRIVRVECRGRCSRSDVAILVPSVHTEGDRDDVRSALSLFMCGSVAVEKYTLLHTRCAG